MHDRARVNKCHDIIHERFIEKANDLERKIVRILEEEPVVTVAYIMDSQHFLVADEPQAAGTTRATTCPLGPLERSR